MGAAAIDWNIVTPGNLVTWLIIVCGWVASWVTLRNRVDAHEQRFQKLDNSMAELLEVMDEIKTQGSPASRQSSIVMNSRIDSQNSRLLRVEDAMLSLVEIKVHVQWMREQMQNNGNGKLNT